MMEGVKESMKTPWEAGHRSDIWKSTLTQRLSDRKKLWDISLLI